jgi:diguanylate cyclase (GGDEF)-like protein/PAS domain S-box-containing protein
MNTPAEVLDAKILVVDDQVANVKLLEYMLASAGYTSVSSVTDPREVVGLYRKNRYDAVLLDLNMPYISGFDVMDSLLSLETDHYLPILVITAQPDHKLRALEAGATDFISKPFDQMEVLTRIRNMLTIRLLHKNLHAYQGALERRSEELSSANRFLDSVIENIPNMIFIKDAEHLRFVRLNRAGEQMIGCNRAEMLGKSDHEMFSSQEADFFVAKDRQVLESRVILDIAEEQIGTRDKGIRILHTKKVPVLDEHGKPSHLLGISEDVTERITMEKEIRRLNAALAERAHNLEVSNEQQQAALNYASMFDLLTGASNRAFFLRGMERLLQSHARAHTGLALVLLDIRHFGRINDSFGKSAGDEVLKLIAKRLGDCSQYGCARIGGNTFAIALTDLHSDSDVAAALKSCVLEPLNLAFPVGGHEFTVAARCGIALFSGGGQGIEELFSNAEAALKSAKGQGEEYLFYTASLNARVAEQLALESELRKAIADQQFVLHYQPKVDSCTGRLTGFEALIRWNSEKRGLVPPVEFIPVLEEMRMILDVGKWALRQAAADYRAWRGKGLNPPPIAVNISALQLRRPDFVETVWEMCRPVDEAPAAIDLEITESVMMEDIDRMIPLLQKLRDAGYGISIDDFGTGYSSFSYLTKIPLTSIKIDRSFIQNLTTERSHNTIVSTIILLAHALKLTVIAEGVETEQQRAQLQMMECDELQGYLLGRPMQGKDAEMLLHHGARLVAV